MRTPPWRAPPEVHMASDQSIDRLTPSRFADTVCIWRVAHKGMVEWRSESPGGSVMGGDRRGADAAPPFRWLNRTVRIAVVAPPSVPVPPLLYGGTEVVIDTLCRGLSALGHDVVLFASGDSTCPVEIRSSFPIAVGHRIGQTEPEL